MLFGEERLPLFIQLGCEQVAAPKKKVVQFEPQIFFFLTQRDMVKQMNMNNSVLHTASVQRVLEQLD